MTDEPENSQQNVTKPGRKRPPVSTSFKPGYDPRRWMKGRGKKPAGVKEAEEIVLSVIWEELSREITSDKGETIDSLRLMIRSMIRNKTTQKEILERVAGKVTERVEHTGKDGNELTITIRKASDGTDNNSQ